jgi:hypothetical protein
MLLGGYFGEAGYINATLGFVIGMAGWFYILYEVFSGEAVAQAVLLQVGFERLEEFGIHHLACAY